MQDLSAAEIHQTRAEQAIEESKGH